MHDYFGYALATAILIVVICEVISLSKDKLITNKKRISLILFLTFWALFHTLSVLLRSEVLTSSLITSNISALVAFSCFIAYEVVRHRGIHKPDTGESETE